MLSKKENKKASRECRVGRFKNISKTNWIYLLEFKTELRKFDRMKILIENTTANIYELVKGTM